MTTYTESFTAADGPLTTADRTWAVYDSAGQGGGTATVSSNRFTNGILLGLSANGVARMTTAMPGADMQVSVTVRGTLDGTLSIYARLDNGADFNAMNGLVAFVTSGGGGIWAIDYRVNGSYGSIGSGGVSRAAPVDGDVLTFGVVGSFCFFQLNGVTICSGTDSHVTTGSYAGLGIQNSTPATVFFDDFSVTDQVVVPTATFTPPATSSVPPTLPVNSSEQTPSQYALMRFFRARPEGINVYCYRVGTLSYTAHGHVTEDDPIALYDSAGVVTTNGWDDLETVFWGGHQAVEVTTAQASALTAAGYTVEYA